MSAPVIRAPDERDVEQLAMFNQRIDARQWGVVIDGTALPRWEDLDSTVQAEYRMDADRIITALTTLGWVPTARKENA